MKLIIGEKKKERIKTSRNDFWVVKAECVKNTLRAKKMAVHKQKNVAEAETNYERQRAAFI